jgi:hypothetical protein
MPVFKRFKGKHIKHGQKDFNRATWVAEGMRGGVRYNESLKQAKTHNELCALFAWYRSTITK